MNSWGFNKPIVFIDIDSPAIMRVWQVNATVSRLKENDIGSCGGENSCLGESFVSTNCCCATDT